MQDANSSGARGSLFVPTGHADLDQLRKDGISTWCPWYKSAAAGAAAGLTLVVAVPIVYLVFALFAAGVVAVQFDGATARTELVDSLAFAAAYGRYAWLTGLAMVGIGVAYALLHRWTVANGHYLRVGPWEMGFDTLFAAVVGYGVFSLAAAVWPPLRVVHAWLFWAWGPVFAWLIARLQELYVLWMVRPDWSLAVESAVRVLMPRRFGCKAEELRIVVDDEARDVTVYAAMDAGEAVRARELIQAIPETRSVTVEAVASLDAVVASPDALDEDSDEAPHSEGRTAEGRADGAAGGAGAAASGANGAGSGAKGAGSGAKGAASTVLDAPTTGAAEGGWGARSAGPATGTHPGANSGGNDVLMRASEGRS